MMQLVESIRERGVITPATVRAKDDGRYELVSGHRRKRACELAGMETPPSEKAFAYKMRLDAMNRQGKRTDLTSNPLGRKLSGKETAQIIGEQSGDSQTQVLRYIRLTNLIPELLQFVDDGRIAFRPAVELSYLNESEQQSVLEAITYNDATPSLAQAVKLKKFAQEGKLSADVVESIMSGEKPNQREKIPLRYEDARRYIPKNLPYNER